MSLGDFCDVVYAYSINSPELRHAFRSSILGYLFDFKEAGAEAEADKTFDGFKSSAMSMLDMLDKDPSAWDLGDDSSLTYTDDRPVS